MAQIAELIKANAPAAPPEGVEPSKGTVNPENDTAAAPWYYVHLSDGSTIKSQDSSSTHMQSPSNKLETLQVVGRYIVAIAEAML